VNLSSYLQLYALNHNMPPTQELWKSETILYKVDVMEWKLKLDGK
jgi:hypothetical protein